MIYIIQIFCNFLNHLLLKIVKILIIENRLSCYLCALFYVNIMKKFIFLIFLGIITILFLPQGVSADEIYSNLEHRVNEIPTFCTMSYDHSISNELHLSEDWIEIVESAISHWEFELKFFSNNPQVWDMKFKEIPYGSQYPNDCTVILQYEEFTPKGLNEFLGVFYTEESWSNDPTGDDSNANKILIFNESFERIVVNDNFDSTKIFRETVLHEIGHSLGLGHFKYSEEFRNNKVTSGIVPLPSIMFISNPVSIFDAKITQKDISKLYELYGPLGFNTFSEN